MAQAKRFPFASEVKIPRELEGWEEMYAPQRLFSKDREEWDNNHIWFADKIHAPEPLYPLEDIFQEAWQIALSQNNTRVFCESAICQASWKISSNRYRGSGA